MVWNHVSLDTDLDPVIVLDLAIQARLQTQSTQYLDQLAAAIEEIRTQRAGVVTTLLRKRIPAASRLVVSTTYDAISGGVCYTARSATQCLNVCIPEALFDGESLEALWEHIEANVEVVALTAAEDLYEGAL